MKILFRYADKGGCGFYRILQPASKIKDLGLAEVQVVERLTQDAINWADIVVVQRASDVDTLQSVIYAQSIGKKVVYEIDDILWGVSPRTTAWTYWNPVAQHVGVAMQIIKQANAVTTTSNRISNEYSLYNQNVYVLPNYPDSDLWDTPANWSVGHWNEYYKRKNDGTVRIGYTCSPSHRRELEYVMPIMERLCEHHSEVQFIIIGYNPDDLVTRIPRVGSIGGGQLLMVPWTDLVDYPSNLKFTAIDIGIAPLFETGFNECRSDIKLKEYSALGIPTVASNMKPYSESMQKGCGFLASSGKEWYDKLEILVQNQEIRNAMGEASKRYYEQQTINKHIHEWIDVYTKILEN